MRRRAKFIVIPVFLVLNTALYGQDQKLTDFLLERFGLETFNINYPLINNSTLLLSELEIIRSSKRVKDSLSSYFGEEKRMFVNRIPEIHQVYWNINQVKSQGLSDSVDFKPRISYPIFSSNHQKALVVVYRLVEDYAEHILLLKKEQGEWSLEKVHRTGVYIDRKKARLP